MVETSTQSMQGTADEINPIISAVLSLFIPGAGQFYHGQKQRGAKIFGALVLFFVLRTVLTMVVPAIAGPLFFVVPLISVGAAYDAYTQANKIIAGKLHV